MLLELHFFSRSKTEASIFLLRRTNLSLLKHVGLQRVHFPPFIGFSIWTVLPLLYPFCPSVTGQRLWRGPGWAPSPENHLTVQSERGPIPAQPLGKPERRPPTPRLSQPLLGFRRSTNWASSSNPQQPFCTWQVRERRESGNRHENDVHRVYGRDGEKEIEIKYLGWLAGGFLILPPPLLISSLNPNL